MTSQGAPSPATAALRALAHPLRLRVFYALGAHETATSTLLAEELGQKVSLISYHLSQLHRYGLIDEAPGGSGDRRERWWKIRQGGVRVSSDGLDPVGAAAAKALGHAVLSRHIEMLEDHRASATLLPASAQTHTLSSDMVLRLAPARLAALNGELTEILDRYAKAPDGDGERYVIIIHGLPFRP